MAHIITETINDLSQAVIGDRIQWNLNGRIMFGTLTEIKEKSLVCSGGSIRRPLEYIIDKQLLPVIIRYKRIEGSMN